LKSPSPNVERKSIRDNKAIGHNTSAHSPFPSHYHSCSDLNGAMLNEVLKEVEIR
jgi:hypothetical protein